MKRMLGQLGAWVPTYLFPHLKGEFSKSARSIGRYLSCLSQILTVSNPRKHIVPRKQTRKSKAPMPIAYGSNVDIAKAVCLRPSHAMRTLISNTSCRWRSRAQFFRAQSFYFNFTNTLEVLFVRQRLNAR